jgi:nucleoside-diphosphate-sugar epimerase
MHVARIDAVKRLLVAGFGDIARRAAAALGRRFEIQPLGRRFGHDLDRPETLPREGAHALLHCAPPPADGDLDTRTANLLAVLEEARILPARVVYVSTSGVYGDCAGARVDESRPPAPRTARGRRRLDAEQRLALWCSAHGASLTVLRAPGIYAAERLPLARLRAGAPLLRREDDVYTNHIHADDLARALARSLEPDAPPGTYNGADDSELLMGDWLDLVADHAGLPRLARVARAELPEPSEFMQESRRLDNRRLKLELGVRLAYPTVHEGLRNAQALGVH